MDFISNFNGLELIFILILAFLLFGPEKIPEIAAKLGSWVRTIRNLSSQTLENLRDDADLSEIYHEGADLSKTLRDTASKVNSSTRSLSQAAVKELERPLAEEENRDEDPKEETDVDPNRKRELLETRLKTLEKELLAIRSELAEEETEGATDNND